MSFLSHKGRYSRYLEHGISCSCSNIFSHTPLRPPPPPPSPSPSSSSANKRYLQRHSITSETKRAMFKAMEKWDTLQPFYNSSWVERFSFAVCGMKRQIREEIYQTCFFIFGKSQFFSWLLQFAAVRCINLWMNPRHFKRIINYSLEANILQGNQLNSDGFPIEGFRSLKSSST